MLFINFDIKKCTIVHFFKAYSPLYEASTHSLSFPHLDLIAHEHVLSIDIIINTIVFYQVILTLLCHIINMRDLLSTFSERLKDLIFDRFSSIRDFSIDIQIPYSTVNSWILKKRCPTIIYLQKLCEYFDVSADYLIGREN